MNTFTSAFVLTARFDLSPGHCRIHFIVITQFYPNRFDLSLDYISENRSGDKLKPELNKNIELNQYFPSTGDKLNPELNENVELNHYLTSTGDKLNPELNEHVELNQYFT